MNWKMDQVRLKLHFSKDLILGSEGIQLIEDDMYAKLNLASHIPDCDLEQQLHR